MRGVSEERMSTNTAVTTEWIIGIDEAGRGPVLGPLVIAGIALPAQQESWLERMGVRDSKLLSPSRRESLREVLLNQPHALRVFQPEEIDQAVEGMLSLNGLEAVGVLDVLGRVLEALGRPSHVTIVIDAPSSAGTFKKQLLSMASDWLRPYLRNARVMPGADTAYRIVGAASILAKTERDQLLREESVKRGLELGSGYPADPRTRRVLREEYERLRGLVRESWQTVKRLHREKQKKLGEWGE